MDRYERILALHRILKSARYPVTVPRLQEELGCSRATVYRDLAFLRDALMAPVVGDGEAGFRYDASEGDRFELPGLWLNSEELHAPGFLLVGSPVDQPPGLNPIVRRVVTGEATGWNRQRLTAASASRSNTRGGVARTTRAPLTEPSVETVNSTCTSPCVPARNASGG